MNTTTNTEVKKVTQTIALQALDTVKSQVTKLNRRAAKLNLAPLTLTVGEQKVVEYRDLQTWARLKRVIVEVTIEGSIPVLPDWGFVAAIEHNYVEGNYVNVVRNISGEDLPASYRTCAPDCNHCRADRRRKSTYIVRNKVTGAVVQIGSTCLDSYLPADVLASLAAWSLIRDIEASFAEEGFGGGGRPDGASLESFLAVCSALIETDGYHKASAVGATGQVALGLLLGPKADQKVIFEQ